MTQQRKKIIVGISGASGIQYGARLISILHKIGVESHLILTKSAKITLAYETSWKVKDLVDQADYVYENTNIAAAIASGSFKNMGMIVAPCSVKTMSEIATGVTSSLLARSADVCLKERRRLVLMVRETPLHLGHLRTMTQLTEMGAIIAPPVPAFYAKPETVDDIVSYTVGRVLDLFDLETDISRWGEDLGQKPQANFSEEC